MTDLREYERRYSPEQRIVIGVELTYEEMFEAGLSRVPWETILYNAIPGHLVEEVFAKLGHVTRGESVSNDSLLLLATATARAYQTDSGAFVQWLRIPRAAIEMYADQRNRSRIIRFHAELPGAYMANPITVLALDRMPPRPTRAPEVPPPEVPPPDPGPAPTERGLVLHRARPAVPVDEGPTRRKPKKR